MRRLTEVTNLVPVEYPTTRRLGASPQERAADLHYAHDLDRLELDCDDPLPLQADGEDLGDVTAVTFEAERDAVCVLT